MIYKGEEKAQIVKGNFHPAELYLGSKKIAGYTREKFTCEEVLTLSDCYNDKIHNAKLSGNCIMDGTPSPETPAEIKSVGTLVTEGEYKGKYKISIKVSGENGETENIGIYLDAPLFKFGSHEDYIDFDRKKVVRNTGVKTFTGEESWYREDFRLYTPAGSKTGLSSTEIDCISNRFNSYSWLALYRNSYSANKTVGIAFQSGSYINITPAQTVPTVAEWREQLTRWNKEGVPLTVVYADAKKEEELNLSDIPTFAGETAYEILSGIPTNISGEYKKGGV